MITKNKANGTVKKPDVFVKNIKTIVSLFNHNNSIQMKQRYENINNSNTQQRMHNRSRYADRTRVISTLNENYIIVFRNIKRRKATMILPIGFQAAKYVSLLD